MIYLYYGKEKFVVNNELKKAVFKIRDKNKNCEVISVSLEDNESIDILDKSIRSIGLFDIQETSSKIKIITVSDFKKAQKNKLSKLKKILEIIDGDKLIFCFIKEYWDKEALPKYVKDLFKNTKIEKKFFGECKKDKAINYIKKTLEENRVNVSPKIIDLVYEIENGDLYGAYNETLKLSFIRKSEEEILESLKAFIYKKETMNNFSKTAISGTLKNKISLLESMGFNDFQSFNGALSYLSKASNNVKFLNKLVGADIKIKSGLLDPDLALLDILLS